MPRLTDFLREYLPFAQLVGAESGSGQQQLAVPSFVHAYLVAALVEERPWRDSVVLVVAAQQEAALELEHELSLYCPGHTVCYLPPRGVWYGSEGEVKPRVAGRRARAVETIRAGKERSVVIVEAATLLEGVVAPIEGCESSLELRVGTEQDWEQLGRRLVALGYTRVDQVEEAGEFAVRGGIVDVFPATERYPVRVEFWGDEIESLRSFSVFTQRSLNPLESVRVYSATEPSEGSPVGLLSLLPEGSRIIRLDRARAAARVQAFANDLLDVWGESAFFALPGSNPVSEESVQPQGGKPYLAWAEIEEELSRFVVLSIDAPGPAFRSLGGAEKPYETPPAAVSTDFASPSGVDAAGTWLRATSGELAVASLPEAEEAIVRLVRDGYRVVIAFEHRAEAERAVYILRRASGEVSSPENIERSPGVSYLPLGLRRHFLLPDLKLALLTETLVFPRRQRAGRRPAVGVTISSFRDLRKGDYVVHEDHGIGRFEGISTRTVAGVTRDYLDLAFRDKDRLYVPHDQIGKVMRYVGAGGAPPALSKLGGRAWELIKSRARRAAREVAGELLQLYAMRQAVQGYQFSEDGEWQFRFEKAFPYEETDDQLRAIEAVKDDMESPRPMDRLICGDVGYGKTEVALRAAFKAVMDGKQVMMLVPTTILAQQHYGTFRERFADFPVKVEMLSRFRSPREQRKILREFAAGQVDVLIGTHRLLSEDVKPKDLGLVIVDEEQRFGVSQKEALRRLKLRVDVLTLTATPIPRTLQMSLSGVRDISVIETPPRDRHPIQTYVGLYDEGMVVRAIQREIDRGGQVYYLHNRVETIDKAAERLRSLMPHVRFAVAHGQMPEQDLERVMLEFLRGEVDVLVTTTIIESGLDIPNANTLIVERADLLGLAQLYQLRGRIGRSDRVAHAFLFHPDEAVLTEEAVARLSTLADYTELGAGFKIALRDLEIRGAGELLGEEQSGHIAAVGFEMYLAMLEEATAALRGEPPSAEKMVRVEVGIDAYVPASFIPYEAARVDLHRRVASASSLEELADLREELEDRFGRLPEPVDNLIFMSEVRVILQGLGADSLLARRDRVVITGLELPPGAREQLRARDRRYVYSPLQGQLSLGLRGDSRGLREAVSGILGDILALSTREGLPTGKEIPA